MPGVMEEKGTQAKPKAKHHVTMRDVFQLARHFTPFSALTIHSAPADARIFQSFLFYVVAIRSNKTNDHTECYILYVSYRFRSQHASV